MGVRGLVLNINVSWTRQELEETIRDEHSLCYLLLSS